MRANRIFLFDWRKVREEDREFFIGEYPKTWIRLSLELYDERQSCYINAW